MTTEEILLTLAFEHDEITAEHRENILAYLRVLRNRSEATFAHSIRVGLLAEKIAFVANRPGVVPKMLLWAGLLHDIGKALVPESVLGKTQSFSDADFAAMEPHAKHGWDLLNEVHDYTAHIIVRHHQFGLHPYPSELPPLPAHLIDREGSITYAARLLALADYYDAMMHRGNDKFGGAPQNPQEKREKYVRDNSDQAELVAELIRLGLLDFS
jgi:putative nucleotidyltransferase with HDIG domain